MSKIRLAPKHRVLRIVLQKDLEGNIVFEHRCLIDTQKAGFKFRTVFMAIKIKGHILVLCENMKTKKDIDKLWKQELEMYEKQLKL